MHLKVGQKTLNHKTPRRNIENNIVGTDLCTEFLGLTSKAKAIFVKVNKWYNIRLKSF